MPDNSALTSLEAERAELAAVAEGLSRSPRLSRLLLYLGEKYFQGESDQLHEYNIATEVFGRSKTAFDAGEDAIARVEAHRLRKRLRDYYETEGKDHPIQLSIPSGTYVPVFMRRAIEVRSKAPADLVQEPGTLASRAREIPIEGSSTASGPSPDQSTFVRPKRKSLRYSWFAAAVAVAAIGVYFAYAAMHSKGVKTGTNSAQLNAAQVQEPLAPGSGTLGFAPIRLMAGYSGGPRTDSAGNTWQPDHNFYGGGNWTNPSNFIARTSDPLLFEQWRTGDFFYDIPLKPGVYELHLYFVTSDRSSENYSTFSVSVNGEHILQGFDINSDALGENIADERIFRDVSPSKDGVLHLGFTSERGAPALNALEILPGTPGQQLPIRLAMQLTSFTDHKGHVWHPDNYFLSGRLSSQRQQIGGTLDPDLFADERYGHFTYALPVDTRGRYTLILHFAEFYFGPHASGVGGVGSRLFRVICNGTTLLDNFDIYKEAGSRTALIKTFYHLKPTAQGKLNLTFEPIANNATVSGIEVLDESR
jgi:hypothetical protein